MAPSKAAFGLATRTIAACAALVVGGGFALTASAQNLPVTPQQRATAQQVASTGVPLSELAPNAPDSHTVKSGDTLWSIAGLFLRSPWRWPELWGMNMEQVRNPHRIYPGQVLVLEKVDGRARLRMGQATPGSEPTETVRVSPRVRISSLADLSIPTLPPQVIEPFLNEAIIVDRAELLERAPRIVATADNRVMLTRGDRAYVRGRTGTPFVETTTTRTESFRIFRNATALKDPVTGRVLGYEAKYLGSAELVRSEGMQPVRNAKGADVSTLVPATVDIVRAKEEMLIGDRLLAEPERLLTSYVPHAPTSPVDGRIVSVYGDAVTLVGQSQVVAINAGTQQGMEPGHVLAIYRAGRTLQDRSEPTERASIKLPDERSGLLMVFRTFENMSYALVLEITEIVSVGDRIGNPR
ncbi:MAG TPA: LysM domain-containing protein [Ramlibacter sp.]|jgi:hypothetical protein|nr:LysM domain-containing protein [Ramlibacter sp.]